MYSLDMDTTPAPAPAAASANSRIARLLSGTRRVLAIAARREVPMTHAQAVAIAAADPTDVHALADAVVDVADMPIVAEVHGLAVRPDGSVVPRGAQWQWCDGDWGSESAIDPVECPVTATDDDVEELIAGSASTYEPGDRTYRAHVVMRLDVVSAGGYADTHTVRGSFEVEPDEPVCSHEDGHDWEDGPVSGSGGGVRWTDTCRHCGCRRHVDTWGTDHTGQVLEVTRYVLAGYDDGYDD